MRRMQIVSLIDKTDAPVEGCGSSRKGACSARYAERRKLQVLCFMGHDTYLSYDIDLDTYTRISMLS